MNWILPHIVWDTPITWALTFYTNAYKSGKAGYKSENLSRVQENPYDFVQKSELYVNLMVLKDFKEPLNKVNDSQYAEKVILHIEITECMPDDTELILLLIWV